MSARVSLSLSADEALVFYEWLARFDSGDASRFEDQAEQRVLWKLEGQLEAALVEPLRSDYREKVALARSRVRDPIE